MSTPAQKATSSSARTPNKLLAFGRQGSRALVRTWPLSVVFLLAIASLISLWRLWPLTDQAFAAFIGLFANFALVIVTWQYVQINQRNLDLLNQESEKERYIIFDNWLEVLSGRTSIEMFRKSSDLVRSKIAVSPVVINVWNTGRKAFKVTSVTLQSKSRQTEIVIKRFLPVRINDVAQLDLTGDIIRLYSENGRLSLDSLPIESDSITARVWADAPGASGTNYAQLQVLTELSAGEITFLQR